MLVISVSRCECVFSAVEDSQDACKVKWYAWLTRWNNISPQRYTQQLVSQRTSAHSCVFFVQSQIEERDIAKHLFSPLSDQEHPDFVKFNKKWNQTPGIVSPVTGCLQQKFILEYHRCRLVFLSLKFYIWRVFRAPSPWFESRLSWLFASCHVFTRFPVFDCQIKSYNCQKNYEMNNTFD